eukprot:1485568-Rhodomonas_salina.3
MAQPPHTLHHCTAPEEAHLNTVVSHVQVGDLRVGAEGGGKVCAPAVTELVVGQIEPGEPGRNDESDASEDGGVWEKAEERRGRQRGGGRHGGGRGRER